MLIAALPLLEAGSIEAIEWSFDALFKHQGIPQWFSDLLGAFASEGRLVGHGVYYSMFSGAWKKEQGEWLENLRQTRNSYQFAHITEHFGFMTGQDFHKGAPLSVPYNASTLRLAKDRLLRLSEASACPVGLENLAFSYSLDDVRRHGDFLQELVSTVNGFIILDLHNIFCQVQNFQVDFDKLLNSYPLDLVREIHISGGSWEAAETSPNRPVRRDTHDNAVPEHVFDYLNVALDKLPNLKFVFLEQMGFTLAEQTRKQQFQSDFTRMQQIVKNSSAAALHTNSFDLTPPARLPDPPYEDRLLARQQAELSSILENSTSLTEVSDSLRTSSLARSDWKIEEWEPMMLETAFQISQKWKDGF